MRTLPYSPNLGWLQHSILLLLAIMCMSFVLPLSAQWSVGVQGGVNFSRFTNFPYSGVFPANSIIRGTEQSILALAVERRVSDTWSVQTGLYLVGRGIRYGHFPDDIFMFDGTSIEIPVLGKVQWNTPILSPYLVGGIVVGYHFRALYSIETVLQGGGITRRSFDAQNLIQPFDIGAVGGLGVSYQASQSFSLVLDARYVLGLISLNTDFPAFTKDLRISAGMMYRLE